MNFCDVIPVTTRLTPNPLVSQARRLCWVMKIVKVKENETEDYDRPLDFRLARPHHQLSISVLCMISIKHQASYNTCRALILATARWFCPPTCSPHTAHRPSSIGCPHSPMNTGCYRKNRMDTKLCERSKYCHLIRTWKNIVRTASRETELWFVTRT